MRLVFRVLFFLLLACGFLISVVYPFAADHQQGHEIARWQALDGNGGFREFETLLPNEEEQVLVKVEVATNEDVDADAIVLTLTASTGTTTHFARTFTLEDGESLPSQEGSRRYVLDAEALWFIYDEPFRFVFTEGEVGMPFSSVELVLIGGTYAYDEAVPPIGYAMMAMGMLGMFFTRRRRGGKSKPPEPPKWGRG